jgi:hypothetical protein
VKQLSKRERTYAVIFGLALVFGVWNYRHLFFGPDDQAPGDTSPVASQAMLAPEQHASAVVRPAVARDSNFVAPSWSGDPFHRSWQGAMAVAQVTRAQAKPPPLTLSAIVVRPNARYAVINGKIVREGQRIGGRTVTLIEKARVVLDDQGVEVTLSL